MTHSLAQDTHFEDEEDWIQVADESFESSIQPHNSLDPLVLSPLQQESFRVTNNGSIIFDALSRRIKKTGMGTQIHTDHETDNTDDRPYQMQTRLTVEERFDILEKLGEGSCSVVFKAREKTSNKMFAIKQVKIDSDRFKRRHCINEILALHELGNGCSNHVDSFEGNEGLANDRFHNVTYDNNNVVKFVDAFSYEGEEKTVGIVLEYMDGGSLASLCARIGAITDESILSYISKECLQGLNYMHSLNIIHRDIKPENMLINSERHIKLSDFGLGKRMGSISSTATTFVGTLAYLAPERARGEEYDFSSDIFSLGLSILSIALGGSKVEPGYWNVLSGRIKDDFLKKLNDDDELKWSNDFLDFVSQCLQTNARMRPDAFTLLQHAFIQIANKGEERIGTYIEEK